MNMKFGPAGLGPVKDALKNLENYQKAGLKACEIAFTYGIYIKNKEDSLKIRKKASELGITLSIHGPYWINLNSDDKEKVEQSKTRILKCCQMGELMNAKVVVFHAGFYGKMSKEETYQNIKKQIIEIQKQIKENNWKIKIAPETMGKVNVFGGIEEVYNLVKDTGCSFCIDFAHILAREKKVEFEKIKKLFREKNWHCHFSGIVYGEKGEKHHIKTEEKYWRWLFKHLPKNKDITIINESPKPFGDSVEGLKIFKSFLENKN